jgi:SAM-dependent methyltransferase
MLALLQTAERASPLNEINNYILHRHIFAYQYGKQFLGDVVMELGCGSGYGMKILSPFCKWYSGIDKKLPGRLPLNPNTALFKGRLPKLNNIGNDCFDTVICFQVIEHITEDGKLLDEIFRVLKPGGKLLLTTPNRYMSLTRNPFHVREYTPQQMIQIIAARFEQFTVQGIYGNDAVMAYYAANKKNVERFTRWDWLNLQYRLPAALLKLPYNIANNINRLLLFRKNPSLSAAISHEDYFTGDTGDTCLDFFVVAQKPAVKTVE